MAWLNSLTKLCPGMWVAALPWWRVGSRSIPWEARLLWSIRALYPARSKAPLASSAYFCSRQLYTTTTPGPASTSTAAQSHYREAHAKHLWQKQRTPQRLIIIFIFFYTHHFYDLLQQRQYILFHLLFYIKFGNRQRDTAIIH